MVGAKHEKHRRFDLAGTFGHHSRALRHKADKPSLMQTGTPSAYACAIWASSFECARDNPMAPTNLPSSGAIRRALFERAPVLEVG